MSPQTFDSTDQLPNATETPKRRALIPTVVVAQIFGIAGVIMCFVWMGYYSGGFDWNDPKLVFNFHPVFMVLGLILCFGDAMLIYRVFRIFPKLPLKAVHAVLMILGLLFSVVGLKSVFDSHSLRGISHMYSLHSWIGLVTVVLFSLQWFVGLITFLVPSIPLRLRALVMPLHTAAGFILFCSALVAAISGITERNILTGNYANLPIAAMLSNFMGLCLILFGASVLYVVHRYDYRRLEPPVPRRTSFASLN